MTNVTFVFRSAVATIMTRTIMAIAVLSEYERNKSFRDDNDKLASIVVVAITIPVRGSPSQNPLAYSHNKSCRTPVKLVQNPIRNGF